MKLRYIYWFAYFNLHEPSVRYRAKYPLEQLKSQYQVGYSIAYPGYDFQNLSNFIFTFFSALLFRKVNSLIVFQKIHTNGIYATALKILLFFRPTSTLYDIDDAEHLRRRANTIHYFMRRCTWCSAGSESLMHHISQFNQNILFLTSPVIEHGFTKTTLEKTFTIGWVGYYGAHRQNLTQLFFPALSEIKFPVTLKILGVKDMTEAREIKSLFSHNSNISVETPLDLDWVNEDSIYKIIKSFDIGVSPLTDNEFNRGKSAFKLKQYLSCGVPALGSRVGENKRFLHDGVNGYLCNRPNDYAEKIYSIKNSLNGRYQKLSYNAKRSCSTFSIQNYCTTLLKYYNDEKIKQHKKTYV